MFLKYYTAFAPIGFIGLQIKACTMPIGTWSDDGVRFRQLETGTQAIQM